MEARRFLLKKVFISVIWLVSSVFLSLSFAGPPWTEHQEEAMNNLNDMVDQGDMALKEAKKASNAFMPDDIGDRSKETVDHADAMITSAENFISHMQALMNDMGAVRSLREHGKEAIGHANKAIQHEKEARRHADAAVRSRINVFEAKNHAKESKERAEDAVKEAKKAEEEANMAVSDLAQPTPPRPPVPPFMR